MSWVVEQIRTSGEGSDTVRLHLTLRLTEPGGYAGLVRKANESAAARLEQQVRTQLANKITEVERLRGEVHSADEQLDQLKHKRDHIPPSHPSEKVVADCEIYDLERRRGESFDKLRRAYKDARADLSRLVRGEPLTTPLFVMGTGTHGTRPTAPLTVDGSQATREQLCTLADGVLRSLAAAEVARTVDQRPDVGRDELARLLGPDPEMPGGLRGLIKSTKDVMADLIGKGFALTA